jgi:putative membrane protein
MVLNSLAGLPAFLAYFCIAAAAVVAYLVIYTRITPYSEFELIKKNDAGVAIALGLSLIGFALPVASAIAHAENVVDCAIWSVIALCVQLLTFYVARIPIPDLYKRVVAGEMASAIWLGMISVTAGLLSAASMSY